ncbi:hypothetical protein Pmani_016904 [Petrolisthes manimaculis]|uniref:Ig-like domain-containing protein n=1 Tax=Petrolisthes manimaculis TaxID=1843537 RepID=A0AAE1PRA8_9EUCA|nr:hypothetical protein Pmani_016904 [Petrolisthes manimaculis]
MEEDGGGVQCGGKPTDLGQNPGLSLTPGVLSDLPHLTSLYLQRLGLDRLPPLGDLPSLRSLDLGSNKVKSVDNLSLTGLPNLQELDLSKNQLTSLTSRAFVNITLIRLNLSRNMIARLDTNSFQHLGSLAELKLSRNRLTPATFNRSAPVFTNLTNLRLLDLNGNRISRLQGLMFEDLKKLKILKLRRNEVASFSDGVFYGLDAIDKLYLDYNNMTVVHKGLLFGLGSLTHLALSHNHIDSIRPDSWKSTQRLVSLDLSQNRLVSLREGTFRGLGDLTTLKLSFNHLAHIEHNSFQPTTSLTVLELDHNQLRWSVEDNSGAFSSLGVLKSLSLAYNSIETIHAETFVPMSSLTTLDLLGNQLRTLPHNPFSTLLHLTTLHLNTSSLVCDCHLAWLPAWLTSFTHNSSNSPASSTSLTVSCNYPTSLRERQVSSLHTSEFSCISSPRPEIRQSPKDQIVLHGTNVTLACVAQAGQAGDQPKFMWRKNNQLLVDFKMETLVSVIGGDGEGGAMHNVTSLLHLQNVTEADSGEFQCVVRNHFGASYSERANIQVHIFPYFTKTPSSVGVRAGEVARLECVASGSPAPEISLLKDGGDDFPAARERRIHVLKNETIFFIKPVRPHDEGRYTCRATNAAGTATAHATVSVRQIPEFTKPPKDEIATLGDNAVLECQGMGLPQPRLTWSKDGETIEEDGHYVLVENSQYLLIKETRMEDVGTYVCELTNILGTARARLNLTIRETGNNSTTTGILVMAGVCCVVVTSLVWVVIIHQTRKRAHRSPVPPYPRENGGVGQCYSSAHALHMTPEMIHPTYTPLLAGPQEAYRGQDSGSEHSSGKDSGTGDSAGQRSSENLPLDLTQPGMRRSLLVCAEPGSPTPVLRGISGVNSMVGDGLCDDLPAMSRPRLSTFSPQHHHHHHHLSPGSFSPGVHSARVRRSSHSSRLLPVSSPVTPSSTLPRHIPSHQPHYSQPASFAATQKPTSPLTATEVSCQQSPHQVNDNTEDVCSQSGQCHSPQYADSESQTIRDVEVRNYNPRASVCSTTSDRRSELDLRIETPEVRFSNNIPVSPTLEPR